MTRLASHLLLIATLLAPGAHVLAQVTNNGDTAVAPQTTRAWPPFGTRARLALS